MCQNVQGLLHWQDNVAMDNVILELCDSCDYFASSLLCIEKKQLSLTITFK